MKLQKPETLVLKPLGTWQKTRQYIDRVLSLVPVILMGVLAMLTYWLVKNTPVQTRDTERVAAAHEIDYYLQNFSVKSYEPDGRLHTIVHGVQANHYADTQILEIEKPQLQTFDAAQNMTRATALRALSNADGSELQLIGQAVVIRQRLSSATPSKDDDLQLSSDFLDFFIDEDRIVTNEPLQLKKGQNTFQAHGMAYDNTRLTLDMNGRVNAQFAPRKSKP